MGVTIHFEGRLKSQNYFDHVVEISEKFAQYNHMEYQIFKESDKILQRVKDEKDWDYKGSTQGIKIQPDINSDPLWIEFDKYYYIQEYCKTQFVDIHVHVKIIELLRLIEPYFADLVVTDEGEYWDTTDEKILQENFDTCFNAIEDAKNENSKLSGPYRITGGRIVDLMKND